MTSEIYAGLKKMKVKNSVKIVKKIMEFFARGRYNNFEVRPKSLMKG